MTMETIFTEATKMDLLQWGIIAFIIFGNGANIIRQVVKDKLGIKSKPKTHEECELFPEHLAQLKDERSIGERITLIKYKDTIYEQMTKVSKYAEKAHKIIYDNYVSLLPENGLSETQRKAALVSYRKDLKIAIDETRGFLRKAVKENHFTEKTDVEFNAYTVEKIQEANDKISEVLDAYYLQSVCIVDREELRQTNVTNCLPQLKEMITQMFFEIREIAEKKEALIREILEGA